MQPPQARRRPAPPRRCVRGLLLGGRCRSDGVLSPGGAAPIPAARRRPLARHGRRAAVPRRGHHQRTRDSVSRTARSRSPSTAIIPGWSRRRDHAAERLRRRAAPRQSLRPWSRRRRCASTGITSCSARSAIWNRCRQPASAVAIEMRCAACSGDQVLFKTYRQRGRRRAAVDVLQRLANLGAPSPISAASSHRRRRRRPARRFTNPLRIGNGVVPPTFALDHPHDPLGRLRGLSWLRRSARSD